MNNVVDKHGEPLEVGSRVLMDGGLVGEVDRLERGLAIVKIDGQEGVMTSVCRPTGWEAGELESLGDGVNQAMRAVLGQPS